MTTEDGGVRNKNEKLQKTVVAKEGEVVQQGHVIADLEAQLKVAREGAEVKDVKVKALTEMVEKLQRKCNGLVHSE